MFSQNSFKILNIYYLSGSDTFFLLTITKVALGRELPTS